MNDCVFCKIANHQAPANIVYEDDLVMAIMDIDPISDGHTLVIPKKEIKTLYELDDKTSARVIKVAKMIAIILKKEFQFDGTMIMEVNDCFQDVPHFHLHVFGRNKNNDIKFDYPKEINNSLDFIKENARKIRLKINN